MKAKLVRWGLPALIVILAAMQLVRPNRLNPPVDSALTLAAQYRVPPDVLDIFNRACIDCHSHRTRWPWYSNVAPASWFLASHVTHGRRKMNLDNWTEEMSFKDVCQEVRVGSMPLKSYLPLHPDARLSPRDVQSICTWSLNVRPRD